MHVLSWFFTDSFIISAAGTEAITLIKYYCIPRFLNMVELKQNAIPSNTFGLVSILIWD